MIYDNKSIDTTQTNWILNIKTQCVHLVCVAHHVDQRTDPSVVSMLSDPCCQTSSY